MTSRGSESAGLRWSLKSSEVGFERCRTSFTAIGIELVDESGAAPRAVGAIVRPPTPPRLSILSETRTQPIRSGFRPSEGRLEVGLASAPVSFDNKEISRLMLFCCRDGDGIAVKTAEFFGHIRTPTFVEANSGFCKRQPASLKRRDPNRRIQDEETNRSVASAFHALRG